MLEDHGETVLNQIIQACDLEHAEPLEALQRLIRNTSPTASCWYSWYSSTARTSSTRTAKAHAGSPTWKRWTPSSCADSKGVFRIDITAAVFTELFITLVWHGRCGTPRSGGQLNSAHTLEQMFLHGASNPARS